MYSNNVAGTLLGAGLAATGTRSRYAFVRLWRSEGYRTVERSRINEQGLPKAMFLREVTLNKEAVHN